MFSQISSDPYTEIIKPKSKINSHPKVNQMSAHNINQPDSQTAKKEVPEVKIEENNQSNAIENSNNINHQSNNNTNTNKSNVNSITDCNSKTNNDWSTNVN